jgi:hypothetical protein
MSPKFKRNKKKLERLLHLRWPARAAAWQPAGRQATVAAVLMLVQWWRAGRRGRAAPAGRSGPRREQGGGHGGRAEAQPTGHGAPRSRGPWPRRDAREAAEGRAGGDGGRRALWEADHGR